METEVGDEEDRRRREGKEIKRQRRGIEEDDAKQSVTRVGDMGIMMSGVFL